MRPRVSIVVPVYNGEKTLSRCLDSLMNLDFSKDKLEVIVVDNNSTDATKDIIEFYPVKYVFESKKGRGAARNKGVKESRGELVAFIDADCVADRGWLTNLVEGFRDEDIGGCGGEIFSFAPHTLIEKYYDFRKFFSQKRGLVRSELFFLPRIATFNAIYRRDVLEEAGLFDDSLITNEDGDLSWRVNLKGFQLNYVPEAIVYHKHPDRLADFFRKCFEYGYTFTYLLEKYTNLIKRPLVNYNDWVKFFLQLLQSTKTLFITLFIGKDIVGKIFPIFNMIEDTAIFSGRIYGLVRIRLRIEKISPQPKPDKTLWRIVNDEALIPTSSKDYYYVLNKIGAKIWTLLIEKKGISEIIDILVDEYKVDKKEVKNDIINLIDELKKENLVPTTTR